MYVETHGLTYLCWFPAVSKHLNALQDNVRNGVIRLIEVLAHRSLLNPSQKYIPDQSDPQMGLASGTLFPGQI